MITNTLHIISNNVIFTKAQTLRVLYYNFTKYLLSVLDSRRSFALIRDFCLYNNKINMEIFKDVKGFEGSYQVSNLGNVKSLGRKVKRGKDSFKILKEKILKAGLDGAGYFVINLYKNETMYHFLVHRLVALTLIPNLENKRTVNHINGIKTDNRVENLEWNTHKENLSHARETGLNNNKGEKCKLSKLKEKEVFEIRKLYKSGRFTQKEIAKFYNCGQDNISLIVNKISWKQL
jgi:hypothetical protein